MIGPSTFRFSYNSLEGGNTLEVSQLDATEEGRVQSRLAGLNAGVDTCGVAVPDVDGHRRNSLAGIDIDILHLEEQVDALAVKAFLNIGPELLSHNIVGSICDIRGENTAGVGAENVLERREHIV